MVSILLPHKTTAQMPVSLPLVAFSTISMPKVILVLVIMEEHNTSTISKPYAKKELLIFSNSVHKNGELMFKLFQDHQQTLLFILVSLILMTELCHLIFHMEVI